MDQFGEDTLTQLAFTIQANKNVYALLLGSGISSSSGIKTGWGITCDLIARYAIGRGEKEPDLESEKDRDDYWATWYTQKYGTEPDYSDILEKLGNTDNERQALVESYIEPTDEEFNKGLKSPTKAHHAIAKLIKRGFIKIIITTNFDRLLEQALNNVGITPTIIASEDDLSGQEPLDHSLCYIIKLHGDYQDRRIKNTTGELSEYSDEYKALLKRIFNDYGLIICGWSAAWDIALKQALRSATSRRYSLFWASYGELGEDANQIVKERKGKVIPTNKINGADGFFTKLQEKVEQIEKLSLRRPRTEALILSTLKDYLSEPEKNRIKIDDLFKEEFKRLLEAPKFKETEWLDKSWEDKFTICKNKTQTLAKMVGLIGIYGTEDEKENESICNKIQIICYQLRNNKIKDASFPIIDDKTNLAYPAYLLFTIYALTLIQSRKWQNLYHLLSFDIKYYYGNAYEDKACNFFGYTQFEHSNKIGNDSFIPYRTKLMQNWGAEFLNELNFDFLITMLDLLCFLTSIQFSKNNDRINELLDRYKDHHDHYHNLYRPSWIAEIEKKYGHTTNGYEDRLTDLDYPLGNIMNHDLKSQINSQFANTQLLNDLEKAGFSIVANERLLEAFINNNRLSRIK